MKFVVMEFVHVLNGAISTTKCTHVNRGGLKILIGICFFAILSIEC
jgi:hypothetical protein